MNDSYSSWFYLMEQNKNQWAFFALLRAGLGRKVLLLPYGEMDYQEIMRLTEFIRITVIFPNNAPGFFLTYVGRKLDATL